MIKQLVWQYYFARKFSASRYEVVMRVFFSKFYFKHFKAYLANTLVMPSEGGNHAICYDQSEWAPFARRVYNGVCRDLPTFHRYVRLIKRTQTTSLAAAKSIARQPLRHMSWVELGKLWRRWDQAHLEHFLKPIWIPFIIEPLLSHDAQAVLTKLERKHGRLDKKAADFDIVFGPDYPNAIAQERVQLIRLVISHKNGSLRGSKFIAALSKHTVKYAFIPCYDVIDAPWDTRYFKSELKKLQLNSLVKLNAELRAFQACYRIRRHAFRQLLKTLKPTKHERELLQMVHEITFIKDERDDYRRRQCHIVQPLFIELARRAKLPYRALLYLIRAELEHWFETDRLSIGRQKLLERMSGYCLVRLQGSPVQVMSGREMKKFLSTQRFTASKSDLTEVLGLSASGGTIRGRAIIIRTKHNLRKVQAGDIMVAVTTSPDYVPAMRLCRGIVTDEGGITSHAAIVARELKVPCVVGTKLATEIFRDGELVEIDGDRGVVRLLTKRHQT